VIHSYLTYLRDRLTVARDLLSSSGSVLVQIGDENKHLIRGLLDEVFGVENFVSEIAFSTTTGRGGKLLDNNLDFVIWYARDFSRIKYRPALSQRDQTRYDYYYDAAGVTMDFGSTVSDVPQGGTAFNLDNFTSQGESPEGSKPLDLFGRRVSCPGGRHWRVSTGRDRLQKALRLELYASQVRCRITANDQGAVGVGNVWTDVLMGSFVQQKIYVVQTSAAVIQRCILLTTDPGDLVLDPTCGSGTTAYVAEQWGRRWITIDTSRVALALARARIMGARYPYYLLADSPEGLRKEAEVSGRAPAEKPTYGHVRHGFVYERVPHITLKSIANNAEIDVIYDEHQQKVQAALDDLNAALRGHKTPFRVATGGREGKSVHFDAKADATFTMPSGQIVSASALVEWEVPREAPADWPVTAKRPLAYFWAARIARQKAIDASIAAKAEFEYLYDRPYEDKKTVRVAGPFTVESLSPHRTLGVDENDELIDSLEVRETGPAYGQTFEQMILDNLRAAGVQQAHKSDRITFSSLTPWPGEMICAEGRYRESDSDAEKRAAIFIGPEFGTVQRPDLVKAAREAGDAGFDILIACAFNYEAHASEFSKLGRIPVLKARMNADLHMGGELKATGKGNLFVVFGEPDIDILHVDDGTLRVHVKGVDVFDPTTGEVRSDGADGIACWFIDTDYNEESFFVRHAYFLGQNDPYGALKTTLKAEIDADVWATLNSDMSRPFPMPSGGRIAVKVINHLGDEVMKVFRVE
jgi:adenine-specific DNA-methyltransferase